MSAAQAGRPPGDGSFPSANGRWQATSNLTGLDGVAATEAWLIPPSYRAGNQSAGGTITIVVAGVAPSTATARGDGGGKTDATAPGADFAFSVGTDGTVTVTAQNNVWNAGAAARTTLQASWDQLLQQLEAAETGGSIFPGATFTVQSAVATALPLPFSEVLLYACGFTPSGTGPHVDLLPGMRLRVEAAGAEYVGPSQPSDFNGFLGSGTSVWEVCRDRLSQRVVFDAFAGAIQAQSPYLPPTTANFGVWGVAELNAICSGRWVRLFYPALKQLPDWPGASTMLKNVTFAATTCRADMDTATSRYTVGQVIPAKGVGPIATTFLRGRAVAVPEFPIWINDTPHWVPVGTTLRQLWDRYLGPTASSDMSGITRLWPAPAHGGWPPVSFDGTDTTFPSGLDIYDMPLVPGTAVAVWRAAQAPGG